MHLALDHLTVSDAYPWELVELAAQSGLSGCCLFLHSMSVIPHMPSYDLVSDTVARSRTKSALSASGVSLDLAYPFTVTGRSEPEQFVALMDAAADLQAKAINLLVYDRDEARRVDRVSAVVAMAGERGMGSVIEFYPSSAIKSFDEAKALTRAVGRSDLHVNVDLLHLYRSGGSVADLAKDAGLIGFAQLADGPLETPQDKDFEAGRNRTAVGAGALPVEAFLRALPKGITLSLEVPIDADIEAGISKSERAQVAIKAFKGVVGAID